MTSGDTRQHRGEPGVQQHYARLAPVFAQHWTYSDTFVAWMSDRLVAHADISDGDQVLDVGCGPGLYAHRLAQHTSRSVVCADPSPAMLDHIPQSSRLVPVLASAEDLASGVADTGVSRFDAIVVKEALHHVPADQRAPTLRGLVRLLAPGGRLVVVMLPTNPGHPLFAAALDHIAAARFTADTAAEILTTHGVHTTQQHEEFPVTMATERYLDMVADRYMSLLTRFSDADLAAGIAEIREVHPGEQLTFPDRYVFVRAQPWKAM